MFHQRRGFHRGKFYGSTVVGERGQVVIPAEARQEMGLEPGEKLLVFGNPNKGMMMFLKGDMMAQFADLLLNRMGELEKFLRQISPDDKEQGPEDAKE